MGNVKHSLAKVADGEINPISPWKTDGGAVAITLVLCFRQTPIFNLELCQF